METKKPTKGLKADALQLAINCFGLNRTAFGNLSDFKEWYNYFLNELQDSADYEQKKPIVEGRYAVILNADFVEEDAVAVQINYGTGVLCKNTIPLKLLFDFIKNPQSYEKKSV